ncbi:MAG: hypothetical protein DME06_15640 [Candidatus Rokuibacteriota bacterium]|nr:MAG: hypothetical protein DME06_15640 [Candidatus Rokubacteria bacterium]
MLVVMGSGETSPTMVTTHRELVARFGPASPRAVLLDTPYGFQENAHEISGRALEYFARSVGLEMEVAGFPGPLAAAPGADAPAAAAAALARLRSAGFVFSGPGSPTYALRVWRESPVPEALVAKLLHGGVVVFASAAAATLGRWALPVYEVYKVGLPPYWLDGLDLLGLLGVGADGVVIPHYDNAEGGTHDTRFCYMGERRLAALEMLLPDGAWILGVDEHTALVVDLDSGQAVVTGRGAVTVRRRGVSRRFPAGTSAAVKALAVASREETVAADARAAPPASGAAVASRRSREAVEAILELDRTILAWSADTLQSDEPDRARAVLHSLIHRLGEAASEGLRDPREVLAPLVEGLIALRTSLRTARAWDAADQLRDRLAAAGVELRDAPEGTLWTLRR